MKLNIDETFQKELPGDPILINENRQVRNAFYSLVLPRIPSSPKLIHASKELAELIGISDEEINSEDFVKIFSGAKNIEKTSPYAMAYAGHQFGNWAGQLGDGRAINLTEIVFRKQRYAIQLKGAGKTPYSRSGDGLAVLRSSIREHLCSEAMHYLGVPTTRSLSLILTGDEVLRDVMYNGNPGMEKGAVVCRISPSFIRFGNFELFAANQDKENLQKLADYTIRHFYPEIKSTGKEKYIQFFAMIAEKTKAMNVHWQRVGFVHGVMNTDNMSILGLTIDYGPYGWLEGYDEQWTPNTTDREFHRYRFGNQANIAQWNLLQLANALYPIIEETKPLEKILNDFASQYKTDYFEMMRAKLGLVQKEEGDEEIFLSLLDALSLTETDMTIFFRLLSRVNRETVVSETIEILEELKQAFYSPNELKDKVLESWILWMSHYIHRLQKEEQSNELRIKGMNLVNPKYVLRNYMAQLVIDEADKGDYELLIEIYELLKNPYSEQKEKEKWFSKRPEWARNKIGSSMLSCSS